MTDRTARKDAEHHSAILEDKTVKALEAFQKDNNLPSKQEAIRQLFRRYRREDKNGKG